MPDPIGLPDAKRRIIHAIESRMPVIRQWRAAENNIKCEERLVRQLDKAQEQVTLVITRQLRAANQQYPSAKLGNFTRPGCDYPVESCKRFMAGLKEELHATRENCPPHSHDLLGGGFDGIIPVRISQLLLNGWLQTIPHSKRTRTTPR
jgi:hypothetical protein